MWKAHNRFIAQASAGARPEMAEQTCFSRKGLEQGACVLKRRRASHAEVAVRRDAGVASALHSAFVLGGVPPRPGTAEPTGTRRWAPPRSVLGPAHAM